MTEAPGTGQDDRRYDVVVVGGGPAGLSGALALARARRSVLVVDAGEPRNTPAAGVHNYLGREGAAPTDLLGTGRAEIERYGANVMTATAVSARRLPGPLDAPDGGFEVTLTDGRFVRGRRLLVTTGLVDELPQVPGLAQRWGRDVLHCPYCHGWETRDRKIGVLATGPLAVHQALMWRQWSADVTLLTHTAADPTDEQREELAARAIAVVPGEVVGLDTAADRLVGALLEGGRSVALDALVVASRLAARSGVLADLGLEPTEVEVGGHVVGSRIPAEVTGATSVPGVSVAGNVADPQAHVIGSAAAGVAAGAAINADLIAEDTLRAVTAFRAR